jgi:hypothetical protein
VKLRKVVVKNLLSYRERTEFIFDNGINILGGKTNLQKIISLTLSKFLIHQYQFRGDDNAIGVEILDPWTKSGRLHQALPKFVGDTSQQVIEIEVAPEARDVANIRSIGENITKFSERLAYWELAACQSKELAHSFGLAQRLSATPKRRDCGNDGCG